ncbi:MAG TPA: HAD family hydrolase [Spirochaetota bacterium]|nr:HAD family hydrolase [Spirochaetota bacterium]HOM37759.1 HAD family hydrolase [Spirochaetota bacterium]HPQ49364.1 HAD family hydrolase [Spirochaetota bacterium]
MVKAVSFDLDGTLYSSEPVIEDAYRDSVIYFNKNYNKQIVPPTFKDIEKLIGQPVYFIYKSLFPTLNEDEIRIIGSIIIENLSDKILKYGGLLFDGVKEVFDYLKNNNYMIFIASNGRREYIQSVLTKFKLECMPFVTIGDYGITKKSEIILYYIRRYNIDPENMIMVGDRASDIEAAREAGVKFVGCNFGHGHFEEIKDANYIIDDIRDIKRILESVYA